MEFYKLYRLIHRRTDWPDLYRWQRRILMPEWYEEREKQARLALSQLALAQFGIKAMLGDSYFLQ